MGKTQVIPDKPPIELPERKKDATLGTVSAEVKAMNNKFCDKLDEIRDEVE